MIKFDEQKQLDSVAGALAIRKEIEGIAADVAGRGYKNICYLGIGGTYASALQTQNHVQEYSGMEIIAQNAALYNTTGNRRIGKDTVIVLSSVTGTTQEVVAAVEKAKAQGAVVIGFVDTADTPLEKLSDYAIRYPQNEQLKFFMLADRLMQLAGDFPQYEQQYAEYDRYLPQALVETEKAADDFGRTFAERHCMTPCTISWARATSTAPPTPTPCATGRSSTGCAASLSMPPSSSTVRWRSWTRTRP